MAMPHPASSSKMHAPRSSTSSSGAAAPPPPPVTTDSKYLENLSKQIEASKTANLQFCKREIAARFTETEPLKQKMMAGISAYVASTLDTFMDDVRCKL